MTFLTDLTLGKKVVLLTAAGLLLGVGVFSSLGIRAVNRATEAMLQDRLTTAQMVADYTDETLGRALTELQETAQAIARSGTGSVESQVKALNDTYSRLSIHTYAIYLINEKRDIVWSQPETARLAGANIPGYPAVGSAIDTGKATVSGLVSLTVSTPVVLLVTPVSIGQSDSRGALAVAVDLARSSIAGFVKPIRLGETGYVEIVDQNGMVVSRTEPGSRLAPFEQSDHSGRFAALIAAAKPTRGVCHTCHQPDQKVERKDVLAFVPLSRASWGVVVRQSEEEALASTRELRQNLLLFGIGLVIVALAFVLVTTRNIVSRIAALTGASQRIARGDLTSPVSTPGRDEVGVLAKSLDDMRVKLKASYSELEQRTGELSSLLSVSEILTSALDLPHLLEAVVAKAVEIIPAADGGVLLMLDASGNPVIQCAIGPDRGAVLRSLNAPGGDPKLPHGDSLSAAVARLLESEGWQPGVQSHVTADIWHRHRHIGSLVMVTSRRLQTFTDSDRRLLQAIADYIAIATEKAHLAREAQDARALYEADRLRSQFISSVSHELRTPLTLIKGYSTSLLRKDTSWNEETQREFLQTIDEKTDELRDLIDKILQSAKLEAGALKLEKEPVLLSRLARKVLADMGPGTGKHRFVADFTPGIPVIEADSRCLEQVLRNLIENAVKYSPDGGAIRLSGEVRDGEAVVSVSDEGIGISAEHQEKVFERFYRVDSPLVRGTPGSGLGLSIVRGHVEAHGGRVWLESTVGKGSTFHFSLPLGQTTAID